METGMLGRPLSATERGWLELYKLDHGCGYISQALLFTSKHQLRPEMVMRALQLLQSQVELLRCRVKYRGGVPYLAPMQQLEVQLHSCSPGSSWHRELTRMANQYPTHPSDPLPQQAHATSINLDCRNSDSGDTKCVCGTGEHSENGDGNGDESEANKGGIDTERGPLWRCSFVPPSAPDGEYALVLSGAHWLYDGISSCVILQHLLQLLQTVIDDGKTLPDARKPVSNDQHIKTSGECKDAVNSHLPLLLQPQGEHNICNIPLSAAFETLTGNQTGLLQQLTTIPYLLANGVRGAWCNSPPPPSPLLACLMQNRHPPGHSVTVTCTLRRLSADATAALAARCKARDVTVHSALMTCVAAAAYDIIMLKSASIAGGAIYTEHHSMKNNSMLPSTDNDNDAKATQFVNADLTVNCRRYLQNRNRSWPLQTAAVVISQPVVMVNTHDADTLWSAVASTAATTATQLTKKVPLYPVRVARLLLETLGISMQFIHGKMTQQSTQPSGSDFLVNNLGNCDDVVSGTSDLRPRELHLLNRITPVMSGCAGHHVFHTLAGQMTYDLCYLRGQINAVDAEAFADAVLSRILTLVDGK